MAGQFVLPSQLNPYYTTKAIRVRLVDTYAISETKKIQGVKSIDCLFQDEEKKSVDERRRSFKFVTMAETLCFEDEVPAKLTGQVIICSIIAAFAGLMFGYDIGISGGVTSMNEFVEKFFPDVYAKKHKVEEDNYCKYDDQMLQLFTSSVYLAAVIGSFFASHCCKRHGRKLTIQLGCVFFIIGLVLKTTAVNLVMLISGRLFVGFGVGFGNQAVPLFISEIALANRRGFLNVLFQILITIGSLLANIVNLLSSKYVRSNGWRVSFSIAVIPAIFLGLGSLMVVDTPTSLIQRGKNEEGLKALKKIRGVENVGKEYEDILRCTEMAKRVKTPFRNLLMKRSSWPQLFCGTILQIFLELTGINVIMFYAPVLFQTMGLGANASLLSTVIIGVVNSVSTVVAIFGADYFGRRTLLIQGALQMLVAQGVVGGILAVYLKATNIIPKFAAVIVVALSCVFVMGFAWSWGPLGWLIASEIYPLETRTAGFFVAVSANMIFTFIVAQAFLTMLCAMKSGIFFMFASFVFVMGLFVVFLLPETKGIPIDEMKERVWKKHWLWKRCFDEKEDALCSAN
nr:sugar transport protein 8-like [Ipomoea batatas]